MVELKKGLLYKEGEDIVVVEPKESVEIDGADVEEALNAIAQHFPNIELLMFNHIYSYSYTF